jgi:hypothetical protein
MALRASIGTSVLLAGLAMLPTCSARDDESVNEDTFCTDRTTNVCRACLASRCCEESLACRADPGCSEILGCDLCNWATTADEAAECARVACSEDEAAVQLWKAVIACGLNQCLSAC